MPRYKLSWKIGGEAGFGIKSAGLTFIKMINRAGYEAFGYSEYPSLIRGGHNTYQATVSNELVRSNAAGVDMLVALNTETIERHARDLNPGAIVLYDRDTTTVDGQKKQLGRVNAHVLHVPFKHLTDAASGSIVMRNTVSLGATQALLRLPLSLLSGVIKHTLARKPLAIEANIRAAKLGYEYVKKEYRDFTFKVQLPVGTPDLELLLAGNEAIGLGALAAGLQFFAAYPMTPSSSLLHYLASKAVSERIVVKHAEDEISVINMALGASHVGARSMIGTSGGGFSLMVEALGLAGITETPLVILEAQRPGPATGLPTWTEQADLRFVMHAAQGEFPRIVLAPGDHEECFYLTAEAFNLADRYQLPVIILSDKFLSESERTVRPFDTKRIKIDRGDALLPDAALKKTKQYARYRVTATGISPRSVPGQKGGEYLANSDEHDETGFSTEEADDRIAQVRKRAAKFTRAAEHLDGANLYGNPRARLTVIGWGSTKGPILDALAWLPWRVQKQVNFLHLNVLWPFPSKRVWEILKKSTITLLVENNATAQLGGLIRQQTGIVVDHKHLRYDGRPVNPTEIKERILAIH